MKENNADNSNSFYLRQSELTQKYVKLQVLKDLLQANNAAIQQKKKLLKEETDALDRLHDNVWTLKNQICEKVWDFTEKHDLNSILNNYPNVPSESFFNCGCENANYEVFQENVETQNLLLEIDKLESDLEIENCSTLKDDLIKSERKLQECEKESPEMQRLKHEINEVNLRISALKTEAEIKLDSAKINSKVQIHNTNILFENNIRRTSPDSSISANQNLRPITQLNNSNVKRKWTELSDQSLSNNLDFVKASDYMKITEKQTQFKNTPSCEKIIAEAVSNEKSSSTTLTNVSVALRYNMKDYIDVVQF